MRYSDDHLNYWGDIYCRARLNEYDLPFAVFIRNPWKFLNEFGVNDADLAEGSGDEPLPPLQAKVRRELLRQDPPVPAKVVSLAEARAKRDHRAAESSLVKMEPGHGKSS